MSLSKRSFSGNGEDDMIHKFLIIKNLENRRFRFESGGQYHKYFILNNLHTYRGLAIATRKPVPSRLPSFH